MADPIGNTPIGSRAHSPNSIEVFFNCVSRINCYLIVSFILLMLVGMPVAYALGLAALLGAMWIDLPLDAVMIQMASGVNKFSLLAIPCFVLAGAIMAEGGMSRRLVAFAGVLIGFVRGGLSLVNILASTFFGAISGSSVADTASIGSVLIPEMEKNGYRACGSGHIQGGQRV